MNLIEASHNGMQFCPPVQWSRVAPPCTLSALLQPIAAKSSKLCPCYPDASFDVVLSQFGHMFAPRPDVVTAEMRRVLKPNGRIAFATWPPEHFVGRMFALVGRNSPPPPPGAAPPPQWGSPAIITERLGTLFDAPFFERGTMTIPALSISHFREFMERSVGPMQKLIERLKGDPQKLSAVRTEFEALAAPYHYENVVHQSHLLTCAQAQ